MPFAKTGYQPARSVYQLKADPDATINKRTKINIKNVKIKNRKTYKKGILKKHAYTQKKTGTTKKKKRGVCRDAAAILF